MNEITAKLITDCWVPASIGYQDVHPVINFVRLPEKRLTDKFSHWELNRCKETIYVPYRELDIQSLNIVEPVGQIFHMSRTGSTLVSEMFRARGDCLVLSEPQGLSDVLIDPYDTPEEIKIERLRGIYSIMSAALGPNQPVVLKWASWQALHVDSIMKAYPETPGCFLVRNPVEILVALADKQPDWMVRSKLLKIIQREEKTGESLTRKLVAAGFCGALNYQSNASFPEYAGALVAATCVAIAEAHDDLMIIDYEEIVPRVINDLVTYFNLPDTECSLQAMTGVTKINAKSSRNGEIFKPDSEKKQLEATPLIKKVAEQIILPALNRARERGVSV